MFTIMRPIATAPKHSMLVLVEEKLLSVLFPLDEVGEKFFLFEAINKDFPSKFFQFFPWPNFSTIFESVKNTHFLGSAKILQWL